MIRIENFLYPIGLASIIAITCGILILVGKIIEKNNNDPNKKKSSFGCIITAIIIIFAFIAFSYFMNWIDK